MQRLDLEGFSDRVEDGSLDHAEIPTGALGVRSRRNLSPVCWLATTGHAGVVEYKVLTLDLLYVERLDGTGPLTA